MKDIRSAVGIFCVAIAIIISILLLIIVFPIRILKDRNSRHDFIALRTQLERERGGVICESIAKTSSKFGRKSGRLYLTAKALEFYDKNYPMNHKNFVIIPKDILDVKSYGIYGTKLAINSRGGWIKINVPAGTARDWKKEITHYKNMQQAYHTEVHTLNADANEKGRYI